MCTRTWVAIIISLFFFLFFFYVQKLYTKHLRWGITLNTSQSITLESFYCSEAVSEIRNPTMLNLLANNLGYGALACFQPDTRSRDSGGISETRRQPNLGSWRTYPGWGPMDDLTRL